MHTRLLPVLCFSLLSACAGLDGGRGIPAPVEDRTGQPAQSLPASPPPPASVPARTNPARTVVPGIDDLPPRNVTPGIPSPAPAPVPVTPAPTVPAMPSTPSEALLLEVDAALANGDLERAAAVAERAVRIAPRSQVVAHAICAPYADDGIGDFQRQPRAILDGAAVLIRALVGGILQKLIEQVTVRAMDFDAIKARALRVLGSKPKRRHDSG